MTFRQSVLAAALMAAALALPQASFAQEDVVRQIDPATLELSPNPVIAGTTGTVIYGSPAEAGLYTAYGVMAEGTRFLAHTHPDARVTVVLSGTMYLGQGESFDEANLVAYPAGTMAITPAGVAHYMYARDGDIAVLEIGSGPSGQSFTEPTGS